MKSTFTRLLDQLNHGLVERDETLKAALLTVLAGENLVLIGPPGTGKSMVARRIAACLAQERGAPESGLGYFEYLLTKFSTPEEIFGPLSITELKADRFKRNTAGYLPTVQIAFLDEIFKASSSILNALLTILNERIYHNGAQPLRVPLQALIAASNELPADQEELAALYDRFLMRCFVDYVRQDNLPRLFEDPGPAPTSIELHHDQVQQVRQAAGVVAFPHDIAEAVQRIWIKHKEVFQEDARERLSDRRLKKIIWLLRVSAASNGRAEVDLSDVFLLRHCLWNHPDNTVKVRELIQEVLRQFSSLVAPRATVGDGSRACTGAEKSGPVLKGFKGSGTECDPFLIESYHHLMDLERAEVGQRGFHFRQSADIDCSALTSWMNIAFYGHYDGGGHRVKHAQADGIPRALFCTLQQGSSVRDLDLQGLCLAVQAVGSEIDRCSSTAHLLVARANASTIVACRAAGSLIAGTATDCEISRCASKAFLIRSYAENTTIRDCVVTLEVRWSVAENHRGLGGIASTLARGSVVERCFVTGLVRNTLNGDVYLHGVAHDCDTSVIRQCALGRLELHGGFVRLVNRIAREIGQLENNASVESNFGSDNINGRDGRTVAAALFKQHYFEHTLGWDFDHTWQWDATADAPTLRAHDGWNGRSDTTSAARAVDLLTEQMRANIWF